MSKKTSERRRKGIDRWRQWFRRRAGRPDAGQMVFSIRLLEPRIVLNATAELTALGDLLITGSSQDDTIVTRVTSAGDLRLTDGAGDVIPISNHPDGPGAETHPLDPAAIVGDVVIRAGVGDDNIDVQLSSGLDARIDGQSGVDTTLLRFRGDEAGTQRLVTSENILLPTSTATVLAQGVQLDLDGDLRLGTATQSTTIDLGDGNLELEGRLILRGDTMLVASDLDLSGAAITATQPGTDLSLDVTNELTLSGSDASGGSLIDDLDIQGAQRVTIQPMKLELDGEFRVEDVDQITVHSDIESAAARIESQEVWISGNLSTLDSDGDIQINGDREVRITDGAVIDAGEGSILIESDGGEADLGESTLSSGQADRAVSIHAAGPVTMGNVNATRGLLGITALDGDAASVRQASGTSILVDRLAAAADGHVLLDSQGNQIRVVSQVQARGNVSIVDQSGNLEVESLTAGDRVEVRTNGNLTIGSLEAATVATIHALRIDDSGDGGPDINAREAVLNAQQGIGIGSGLEIAGVQVLSASTDAGGIDLIWNSSSPSTAQELSAGSGPIDVTYEGTAEDASLELQNVRTGDGSITIDANRTILAMDVVSENQEGGDHDITINAIGSRSDVVVTSIVARQGADVMLLAGDDVIAAESGATNVVADDLAVFAGNASDDALVAIRLSTNVNELQAEVTGPARGDLLIDELDSLVLASSDRSGDEIVATSNGQVVISAGEMIVVADHAGDDGADLKQDPELIAGGDNGRIDLQAAGTIELRDGVQLHAFQVRDVFAEPETDAFADADDLNPPIDRQDRSIYLSSERVILGANIELATGPQQSDGVARLFAPRPIVEIDNSDPDHPRPVVPDDPTVIPAFFDPQTVDTNILEQAVVNDATGILSMDVGQPGERGLTVDIDWGAETRRYQQINGVSADSSVSIGVDQQGTPLAPVTTPGDRLSVTHFYTEEDILDSRENSRDAATMPLEVRFSVRHHNSILVQADSIQQSPDLRTDSVEGGIASTTDNRLTAQLENGQASFIIPSLSIPVAFFPVRDVIPDFVEPEFVVQSETVEAVTQSTVEITESTTSSSPTRQEFLQIRVLSPDPDGEDLASPQRLPDDIMEGNRIDQLLRSLPDGSYNVEYVLGDGNERSILQVDVRDGEATIPGDDLEEGRLRLRRLQGTPFGSAAEQATEPQDGNADAQDDRGDAQDRNGDAQEVRGDAQKRGDRSDEAAAGADDREGVEGDRAGGGSAALHIDADPGTAATAIASLGAVVESVRRLSVAARFGRRATMAARQPNSVRPMPE